MNFCLQLEDNHMVHAHGVYFILVKRLSLGHAPWGRGIVKHSAQISKAAAEKDGIGDCTHIRSILPVRVWVGHFSIFVWIKAFLYLL